MAQYPAGRGGWSLDAIPGLDDAWEVSRQGRRSCVGVCHEALVMLSSQRPQRIQPHPANGGSSPSRICTTAQDSSDGRRSTILFSKNRTLGDGKQGMRSRVDQVRGARVRARYGVIRNGRSSDLLDGVRAGRASRDDPSKEGVRRSIGEEGRAIPSSVDGNATVEGPSASDGRARNAQIHPEWITRTRPNREARSLPGAERGARNWRLKSARSGSAAGPMYLPECIKLSRCVEDNVVCRSLRSCRARSFAPDSVKACRSPTRVGRRFLPSPGDTIGGASVCSEGGMFGGRYVRRAVCSEDECPQPTSPAGQLAAMILPGHDAVGAP